MMPAMNRYRLLSEGRKAALRDRDFTSRRLSGLIFSAAILFSFACATRAQTSSATGSQGNNGSASAPAITPPTTPPPKKYRLRRPKPSRIAEPVVLVGAGDIAGCKNIEGAQATAKLIQGIPGTVFAAGDLVYENGTVAEFRNC